MSDILPVKTILVLSANPKSTSKLRLDEEVREIRIGLERSKKREYFDLIQRWAVRPRDIQRAMLDDRPNMVHFSGHGAGNEGLIFEDETGQPKLVEGQALARLFGLFSDSVECVVLNGCYSEIQAKPIAEYIENVIGMTQAIGDKAAIEFSVGFYDALGAGQSVEFAYRFGCNAVALSGIPESATPVLIHGRKKLSDPIKVSQRELDNHVLSDDVENSQSSSICEKTQNPHERLENKSASPNFKIRFPGGQKAINSPYYIRREPFESMCYREIERVAGLVRIQAPQQMGKTSLLMRILNHGKEQGYRTACLNFQRIEEDILSDLNRLNRRFCTLVSKELNLLTSNINEYWDDEFFGPNDNLFCYFEEYILPNLETPMVLGIDEFNCTAHYPRVAKQFLYAMRYFHEKAKRESLFSNLRMIITFSSSPYELMDISSSPFNVGMLIELPGFNPEEISDFATRYELDLNDEDIQKLIDLTDGHPYLVEVALYYMSHLSLPIDQFYQKAFEETGPYGDHLRFHLWTLRHHPSLLTAIKQLIKKTEGIELDSMIGCKLDRMGLVRFKGNRFTIRNHLYREYFRKVLV